MAETEQVMMTDVTGEKTSNTTKKDPWKWPKRKRTANKSGVERLRRALDKRVGKNSEKLADVLTEKALGGNLADAKALIELAEGKKPVEKPKKKRRWSAALALGAEPEWVEPPKGTTKYGDLVLVDGEWKLPCEIGTRD
jgi:hypothetical protein